MTLTRRFRTEIPHSLALTTDSLSVDDTRRKRRGGRLGDPTPDATNQTLWRKAA